MASMNKIQALRRIRAAIDPDMDFKVSAVKTVHRVTPSLIEATVIACEGGRGDRAGRHSTRGHCYPVKVTIRTRYDVKLGGRRR